MSRYALAVALVALSIQMASAFQNEPEGFRGIAWGTPLAQIQAKLRHEDGGGATRSYRRAGENLSIGQAKLSAIHYLFYKSKFSGAMIEVRAGAGNASAILEASKARFGEPDSANDILERYFWVGERAQVALLCGMQPACTLVIRSTRLAEQEQADDKAAARKAGKDF